MSRRPPTLLPRLAHHALLLATILVGASLAAWLDGQGFISLAHDLAPAPFRDGDVVSFVGDSITEDGRFIEYLHAFYLTRFPDRRIRFLNNGIPGDSVGGARRRVAWDVIPEKPTVVSLMFGMNDVRRRYYDPTSTVPDAADRRARALDDFRWNMDVLAGQLTAAAQPRLIFVTSSPYDETAALEAPSFPGVNRALARTRPLLARLARKHRGRLIDLHAPLTDLNANLQASSPAATLIGPDRIHPGAPGHLLIACHYLLAQDVPAIVSDFALDAATGKISRAVNGRLQLLSRDPDHLVFECEERSLPFPIDAAARAALDAFPVHEKLNRQLLSVSFADADAAYRLLIDGETIADFSAAQLRHGINLAPLARTPQSRQAQALLDILEQRRHAELQLRRVAAVRALLRDANLDPADDAATDLFFADHLANPDRGNHDYFEPLFADYRTLRHTVDATRAELGQLTDLLHRLNRPLPHRYEFIRLRGSVSSNPTRTSSGIALDLGNSAVQPSPSLDDRTSLE